MNSKVTNQKRETLNLEAKNILNSLVKYPKLPSAISKSFEEYDQSSNVVKYIFFYVLKQYQDLNLDTFLGQKWIEITPEDIANEMNISINYLLEKTIHYTKPYQCYQLESKKIPVDPITWDRKNKRAYQELIDSGAYIYDTVFSDALYRMLYQSIALNIKIEKPLRTKWNEYYNAGFTILESLKIVEEKGRIMSARVKLSNKLISQIHLFFTLVQPKKYHELLIKSKGHTETSDLYLFISNERNLHFFGKHPKDAKEKYKVEFYKLCEKAKLQYKKEPGDETHWRYENARKSLTRKLRDLVKSELITDFFIERVYGKKASDNIKENESDENKKSKLVDVHLTFKEPDEKEMQVINEFRKNREDICVQKWLSFAYKNILVPGIQPWDNSIINETEILEKYCNQEYYTQWLAHKNLHVEEKRKALLTAYTELFGNESKSTFPIEKKLEEANKIASQRLKENKQPLLEARDWSRDDIINTLEKQFTKAFKCFLKGKYIPKKMPVSCTLEVLKQIPTSPIYLYVFLKHPDFKTKDLPSYIKNINIIQAKALGYKFGEEKNALWTYCKDFLKEDSLIMNLDKDIQKQINSMNAGSLEIGRNTLVMNAPYYSEELELLIEKLSKSANINIELKK